ncbi:hypothetical protein BLNAU_4726 [Blattamonas nauphoetae]|uniref:Uncharacterized protein n=1 Tax=Blattamonas nauphoetae TaxID=2049346 RepID=A0ABQ9Y907_9EUKA|nr:hypothetical protein BLNAU_4726 [Blattamonas nauphoetae]
MRQEPPTVSNSFCLVWGHKHCFCVPSLSALASHRDFTFGNDRDDLSPVSLDCRHTLLLLRRHSSIVDDSESLLFMLVDFRPFINLMLSSHPVPSLPPHSGSPSLDRHFGRRLGRIGICSRTSDGHPRFLLHRHSRLPLPSASPSPHSVRCMLMVVRSKHKQFSPRLRSERNTDSRVINIAISRRLNTGIIPIESHSVFPFVELEETCQSDDLETVVEGDENRDLFKHAQFLD